MTPAPNQIAVQKLFERVEREARQWLILKFTPEEEKIVVAALHLLAQEPAAVSSMAEENKRLRETLSDLANHGIRHDLLPTLTPDHSGELAPSRGWNGYLDSIDRYVRDRAAAALMSRK